MINKDDINSLKRTARFAAFFYLLMAITSPIGLVYMPSKLIVSGDAALTASNILASEFFFRFGIISNIIGQIAFILLAITLYQLFKAVHKVQARMLVGLVLAAVPIAIFSEVIRFGALIVIKRPEYLKAFEPEKLNALMMVLLNIYNDGIMVASIFWGLWLFPFGYLVYKSGFFPKILGVLLIINCFAYLVDSFSNLLNPAFHSIISTYLIAPISVGEITMILWLLFIGARVREEEKLEIQSVT